MDITVPEYVGKHLIANDQRLLNGYPCTSTAVNLTERFKVL